MRRPLALAAAASLILHTIGLAGVRPHAASTQALAEPDARSGEASLLATTGLAHAAQSRAAGAARVAHAQEARAALLTETRAELRGGRLALGRFLLRASAIEAEALGQPLDMADAEARYASRLTAMREALQRLPLREAAAEVFEDLRYYGQPGGLVAEALLEGGGSCEQIAQLVAATAHDAGQRQAIALRFYGGLMADGAAHIAPVALDDDGEHDLTSGKAAAPGGVRFSPEDLVEAYARAHGLASSPAAAPRAALAQGFSGAPGTAAPGALLPPAAASTQSLGTQSLGSTPTTPRPRASADSARPTLFAGMPPNQDRYPGALPLYASRAVAPPGGSDDEDPMLGNQGRTCAYVVRMAALIPVAVDVATGSGWLVGEPRRQPTPRHLERMASVLSEAEILSHGEDLADRLMAYACLAALGASTGVDMALAGERRLSTAALARAEAAREAGREALAQVRWDSDAGAQLRQRLALEYGGRTWLLLFLDGGREVVLDLVDHGRRDDWGQVSALAALVLWPLTRPEGLAHVDRLSPRDQLDVMHEIFHAHDHLRPWPPNVELSAPPEMASDAPGTTFLRAYRVFRSAAFRLWEAQGSIAEMLDALPRATRDAGLDAGWEAALIDYTGRNAMGLHTLRPTGMEVVRSVKQAVLRSGHPSLDTLRRQLDYIEAQRALTASTLADASRLP
ncbi:hypothetical protein [Chondromyces apiculatus]|uniref:Transglutaminase-like domain-containing protein n=1 Tax=Chondromyces apiculatus DSM 436 TaxID=1192034 RepID=A0A017SXX4_9BACT|nr:hypothetical protein [Chondromyces apiculatus]EYF01592.1 Hypothetical protein CAP_8032 [Chondromyces apiculatus DSM 436]